MLNEILYVLLVLGKKKKSTKATELRVCLKKILVLLKKQLFFFWKKESFSKKPFFSGNAGCGLSLYYKLLNASICRRGSDTKMETYAG